MGFLFYNYRMKVSRIINIITTYNNLQRKLTKTQQEYNEAEVFDDYMAMGKAKFEIECICKEIGQFLDCEV